MAQCKCCKRVVPEESLMVCASSELGVFVIECPLCILKKVRVLQGEDWAFSTVDNKAKYKLVAHLENRSNNAVFEKTP